MTSNFDQGLAHMNDHIAKFANVIRNAVHSADLTDAARMNPLHSSDRLYTSQTHRILGIFVGLAVAVFILNISFFAVRHFINGCGGRAPRKFGYDRGKVVFVRICYWFFLFLSAFAISAAIFGDAIGHISLKHYHKEVNTARSARDLAHGEAEYLTQMRWAQRHNLNKIGDRISKGQEILGDKVYTMYLSSNYTSEMHLSEIVSLAAQIGLKDNAIRDNLESLTKGDKISQRVREVAADIGRYQMTYKARDDLNSTVAVISKAEIEIAAFRARYLNITRGGSMWEATVRDLTNLLNTDIAKEQKAAKGHILDEMRKRHVALGDGATNCKYDFAVSSMPISQGLFGVLDFERYVLPATSAIIGVIVIISVLSIISVQTGKHGRLPTLVFMYGLMISFSILVIGNYLPASIYLHKVCAEDTLFQSPLTVVESLPRPVTSQTVGELCNKEALFSGWKENLLFMESKAGNSSLWSIGKILADPLNLYKEQISPISAQLEEEMARAHYKLPNQKLKLWKQHYPTIKPLETEKIINATVIFGQKIERIQTQVREASALSTKLTGLIDSALIGAKRIALENQKAIMLVLHKHINRMQNFSATAQPTTEMPLAIQSTTAINSPLLANEKLPAVQEPLCKRVAPAFDIIWLSMSLLSVFMAVLVILQLKGYKHIMFYNINDNEFYRVNSVI